MPDEEKVCHAIAVDLATVWGKPDRTDYVRTLAWGDNVEVEEMTKDHVRVKAVRFVERPDGSILPQQTSGFIKPPRAVGLPPDQVVTLAEESPVLKVNFVDVQQGDGSVIETPGGKVVLLDGGDNQLFARYLAGRFRGTSEEDPKEIDCIVVTHGDADHFLGLTEIHRSEKNRTKKKRLFVKPLRVYHNGLVKRPSKDANGKRVPDAQLLGQTVPVDDEKFVTELETDLLAVPPEKMNLPFRRWQDALRAYQERYGSIEFKRLAQGDDDAFTFLRAGDPRDRDIRVEVLGPMVAQVHGRPALRLLGKPPKGPRIRRKAERNGHGRKFGGFSASHTINGHSVILRVTYGGFRFLFAGDLNEEAELELSRHHADKLRAEVFKTPHHGSADFYPDFLKAVAPVVSVVSSGDESARKEYIHPRANLVGSLGKYSRVDEPLVLVTEMVAFFNAEGYVRPEIHQLRGNELVIEGGRAKLKKEVKREFFAFSRTAFGMVKTRTDGKRLLVYTDSGNVKLKEAYAFTAGAAGDPIPVNLVAV